jgi:hypothetical protein
MEERIRPGFGDPAGGGAHKTRRAFFDFIVGGLSLYDVAGQDRDLVSVIWTQPPVPAEQATAIRRLLLAESANVPNGRVPLYICPECGDLGCGALTIHIDESPEEIIWKDFGFENNYEDTVERAAFSSLGPYHFERREYQQQLQALLR